MTAIKVIDASALAAILFGESEADAVASYLWLATKLNAELVTLDKALHAAWIERTTWNSPTPPPL